MILLDLKTFTGELKNRYEFEEKLHFVNDGCNSCCEDYFAFGVW